MKYFMAILILISGVAHSTSEFDAKDERIFEELITIANFETAIAVYKKYSAEYNSNDEFDVFPRAGAYSGQYLDLMTVEAREVIADACGKIYMRNTTELYPKALTEDGLKRIYKGNQVEVNL